MSGKDQTDHQCPVCYTDNCGTGVGYSNYGAAVHVKNCCEVTTRSQNSDTGGTGREQKEQEDAVGDIHNDHTADTVGLNFISG